MTRNRCIKETSLAFGFLVFLHALIQYFFSPVWLKTILISLHDDQLVIIKRISQLKPGLGNSRP